MSAAFMSRLQPLGLPFILLLPFLSSVAVQAHCVMFSDSRLSVRPLEHILVVIR